MTAVATPSSLDQKLDRVVRRHAELGDRLAQPDTNPAEFGKLSKEYSDLTPMVDAIALLRKAQQEVADLETLEASEEDLELRQLAEAELPAGRRRIAELEQSV